ncbi:hypothetical protein G6M89_11685 [Natronolimnobius sp. AArcel1]|uniref:hypothetical protein n=1 Tax=Natronolimnobius sp. AArcel1 TaxID=1679093 RepID=UPI0013EAA76B|nr:hypothetical protein [Natronolimnobius sp. AArcel1]NGM69659.1 hypothetical protein [Natronolimnobius sp. AArcel1]
MASDLLERVRKPAYTGENRCLPCTIANAGLVALAVGVLLLASVPLIATVVATVGLATIWLRGYVVPYTPQFAPRLAAMIPGTAFKQSPDGTVDAGLGDRATESAQPSGDAVVEALLEAAVVVPERERAADRHDDDTHNPTETDAEPGLTLEPAFRDEWRQEMKSLRERDIEELAAVADDLTSPSVDVRVGSGLGRSAETLVIARSGTISLRREIAIAELAAARALESRIDDPAIRLAAGRPLRSLLAACPLCDRAVTISQSSCCGEVTPVGETPPETLFCPDCNVRLFRYE